MGSENFLQTSIASNPSAAVRTVYPCFVKHGSVPAKLGAIISLKPFSGRSGPVSADPG